MDDSRTAVAVARIEPGYREAIDGVFQALGGIGALVGTERRILIKPNAVAFNPEHFTSIEFLEALFSYLRDYGYTKLALMENTTNGAFTRLVFAATGYFGICRRFGVKPVLLDEEPYIPLKLPGETKPINFPKILMEEVLEGSAFYLNCPKFKTHSMTVLTLGVKNQQGLLDDRDKMFEHHHQGLHRRLARIYKAIRPHFCLVDAKVALRYGHFPAKANLADAVVPCGVVFGGPDTVAVDVVGARILGYTLDEVEHLRICNTDGLGQGDLTEIDIIGELPELPDKPLPYQILRRFPDNLRIVAGKEMACTEGCRGNTEVFIEYLAGDFRGKGGFSFICGKGISDEELEGLPKGPILVVGPCAVQESLPRLEKLYPRRKIRVVNEHNDLAKMATQVKRLMGVSTLRMSPLSIPSSLYHLGVARIKGSRSRIPSLI